MKIKVELTFLQLSEIIHVLQQDVIVIFPDTIAGKANKYLFENVFKTLLKKQIDKFEHRERFTISMPYPEASALLQSLQAANFIEDDYRRNVWLRVLNELHQKLSS